MTRLSDERLAEIRAWMAAGRYHGLREVLVEVDRLRATEAELHRMALIVANGDLDLADRKLALLDLQLAVLDRCKP